MKKLNLVLLCLACIALLGSCKKTVENPEPTISVYEEEGYVKDGDVVDLNTEIQFGFVMASNAETEKELKSLTVNAGGVQETIDLSGLKEYTYKDAIAFTLEAKDVVAEGVITATVTDEDGETATATITLSLNEPAQALEVKNITWVRKGSNSLNATEMAEYGLQWLARDPYHANIRPMDGCSLYVIENAAAAFEGVTTDVEKAAYFANLEETSRPVEEYRNISTSIAGDTTYNDVLAVIDAQGNKHLVLFVKANIQTGDFGVQTTITGNTK